MLMLDGATQITKRDEFIYQEMMSHVPMFAHGKAQERAHHRRRRLRHRRGGAQAQGVKRLTQVEIDASVVEFSKEHFPEFTKPVFADKRFESVIDDGMKYVARTDRRFDVIIVDSTDPQGPGKVLFSQKFYAACKRCMAPGRRDGDAERRADLPAGRADLARRPSSGSLFADGTCYVAAIPTYIGGHMAMGWATDDRRLRQHPVKNALPSATARPAAFKTKYWTPEVHAAAFALPRFIADLVERPKRR